jgi:DNA helicase-2/ATP-dependent DNA helicase PcrA
MEQALAQTGYRQALAESESELDQERLANIEELLTAAGDFDAEHPQDGGLEAFLEQACLVNDTDAWADEDDSVTLMTLHAAKGLEFPVVYIIALEEGVLPHERSRRDEAQLEEERRLLFVGITRAQQELQLSFARFREYRGRAGERVPSSFLMELSRDEMETTHEEPLPRVRADTGAGAFASGARATGSAGAPVAEAWGDAVDPLDFAPVHADDPPDWRPDAADPARATGPASAPSGAGNAQPRAARPLAAPLRTAAELVGAAVAPAPAVPPDAFQPGMIVTHPDYGLGKVVAVDGSGRYRGATVAFASAPGERRFILANSPLRPAAPT